MSVFWPTILAALWAGEAAPECLWAEVSPASSEWRRSPDRRAAVVLIHGLRLQPIRSDRVYKADFATWQRPGSPLVEELAKNADVYSFAYSQNSSVDAVGQLPKLRSGVGQLRELGYESITLVGYSAGGLIARHLVEDYPECGVSKVVQVCTPNGGSWWGYATIAARAAQEPFLQSLTREGRLAATARRAGKRVPPDVEFVCIVGILGWNGDLLVGCNSQWSEDLQRQGIPVVPLRTSHIAAMKTRGNALAISEVVFGWYPRWPSGRVAAARRELFRLSANKE